MQHDIIRQKTELQTAINPTHAILNSVNFGLQIVKKDQSFDPPNGRSLHYILGDNVLDGYMCLCFRRLLEYCKIMSAG